MARVVQELSKGCAFPPKSAQQGEGKKPQRAHLLPTARAAAQALEPIATHGAGKQGIGISFYPMQSLDGVPPYPQL